MVKLIIMNKRKWPKCKHCGKPLKNLYISFCSPECSNRDKKTNRIRVFNGKITVSNWSEERKQDFKDKISDSQKKIFQIKKKRKK